MTEELVMQVGAEAIKTTIYLAGPMLLAALSIGIVVSVLQAVTQINESTLTFIPKMIAVIVVLAVMAPWMIEVMKSFTADVIGNAGEWVSRFSTSPKKSWFASSRCSCGTARSWPSCPLWATASCRPL